MARHIDDLFRVERAGRDEVSRIVGMNARHVGNVFGCEEIEIFAVGRMGDHFAVTAIAGEMLQIGRLIIMDRPHITGTLQAAVQIAGIATDYISAGWERGDEALTLFDEEIKNGKYGGIVKGANYLGQILADDEFSDVLKRTATYWSSVSPSEVWKDTRDVWKFLF